MMNVMVDVGRSLLAAVTWADLGWMALRLLGVAVIGHLILALLPRATAATRHVVALASLLAVGALPMATALLPTWSWAVWPSPLVSGAVSNPAAWTEDTASQQAAVATGPQAKTVEWSSAAAARTPASSPPRASWPIQGAGWLVVVTLGIATGLLARVGLGLWAAHRLCERAEPVHDPALQRELQAACERLEVWEPVDLRTSARIDVPVVSGVFGLVLLLPPQALTWGHEKRWTVFLHEVAHLRRRDAVSLLVARIVTASLWFHPLVWTLARVARRECERACDDVVLSSGVRASDYADHLLAIAQSASGRFPAAGATLAFARPSSLETRLIALLGRSVRRGPPSPRVVTGTIAALLGFLLVCGSVRVVAAPATQSIAREELESKTQPAAASEEKRTWTAQRQEKTVSESEGAWTSDAEEDGHAIEEKIREAMSTDAEFAQSRSGEGWYDRARDLYQRERYASAAVAYQRAARGGYRPATAWYNAACSFALDGQAEPALGALQEALDHGFDQIDLIQSDSDLDMVRSDRRFQVMVKDALHSDAGEAKRRAAVARFQALRESGSDDEGEWKSAGMSLLRAGEPGRASEAFERQYRIDKSPNSIYNRACAQAQAGNLDEAIATLQRAIEAGAGDGEMLRKDSDLIPLRRDPRFERLARLATDLELYGRGSRDDDPSSWRAAMPRFERVAEEHPHLGRAWSNLGYARLRAQDARGSLEAYHHGLELDYRRPSTLYNLACAAALLGDRDAAMEWLEKAEAAGMRLQDIAPHDHDLDPLRSDARFRAMEDRWDAHRENAKKHGKQDKRS